MLDPVRGLRTLHRRLGPIPLGTIALGAHSLGANALGEIAMEQCRAPRRGQWARDLSNAQVKMHHGIRYMLHAPLTHGWRPSAARNRRYNCVEGAIGNSVAPLHRELAPRMVP